MPEQDKRDKWHIYIRDTYTILKLTLSASKHKLIRDWISVPLGISIILSACYGVDALFQRISVAFPASVACLALLFGGLLLTEVVLGTHLTRKVVGVINVPADWSLRWIGLFFTPAFVTIPLSPAIGVGEVFKIIAVFVIGFVIMMVLAAYLTRGLQILVGRSKRSETQRGEEIHVDENADDIPLHQRNSSSTNQLSLSEDISSPPQLRLQQHHYTGTETTISPSAALPAYPTQSPPPPSRCTFYAKKLTTHLDTIIFTTILAASIPIYFTTSYAMPLHLAITTLTYRLTLSTPSPWKTYLHPVLTASLLTVLLIWPLALLNHSSLQIALQSYKSGTTYLHLFSPNRPPPPGAGDIFSTVLDASIVSLALPMFQYRRELKQHFFPLVIPNVLIAVGSVFSYPPICYALGIEARRSLAFASRSLTLALAMPATKNLRGDTYTVAALAIASGILGVLVAERMMRLLRIPEDDYVTRGITLGVNSSAIGTALLLRTDPRAAALSSLSMTLFGTITVLLTSIPPVASVIRGLVGL